MFLAYATAAHEGTKQKMSHSGQVGSRLYMAPEQLSGGRYDEKVDIFALGIILSELNCLFQTGHERIQVFWHIYMLYMYAEHTCTVMLFKTESVILSCWYLFYPIGSH